MRVKIVSRFKSEHFFLLDCTGSLLLCVVFV